MTLHASWTPYLNQETKKPYYTTLTQTISQEYQTQTIYPPQKDVFRAFELCPWNQVKVVIIGQDPYHNDHQANGLAFSVDSDQKIPPSLKNIFKEIQTDLGIIPFPSGDLSRWANQGVLLLNSVLTVRAHTPASHKQYGWETFTDAVIRELSTHKPGLVYILWGKYAQTKGSIINKDSNLVLESAHPSPFSARNFFGNHHFSQTNSYLETMGEKSIDWK